jgi:hypothetical protein
MTWWYAAIRPRFGAGPKIAAIAGLAVCLIAVGQLLKSVANDEPVSSLASGPGLPFLYFVMIVASSRRLGLSQVGYPWYEPEADCHPSCKVPQDWLQAQA